jgi:hypothetical protein
MYSIWLRPSAPFTYRQIIQNWGESFGTPVFEPHITLFSGIDDISDELFYQLGVLAALNTSFELRPKEVLSRADYFRALYLSFETTPPLKNIYAELQTLFPHVRYPFEPHLSLLYGEIEAAEKRRLLTPDLMRHLQTLSFSAQTISIMDISDEPEMWFSVEDFPLFQPDDEQFEVIRRLIERVSC